MKMKGLGRGLDALLAGNETAGKRASPSLEMGNVAALGTLPAPSRNNTAGKRGPKRSAIAGRRRAQIRRVSPPPGILGKGAGHSVASPCWK